MTKEEKGLKKDILFCLNRLQECVSKMATGQRISACDNSDMLKFGNEIAIVIDKCKKADIYLNIEGNGKWCWYYYWLFQLL